MIELDNRTEISLEIELLESIATHLSPRMVELLLVNEEEMRQINRDHRGIDKSTDVLSFPLSDEPFLPLGSIVISLPQAEAEAHARGHTLIEEVALLFIHGMLHLLGYDHEVDAGEQRAKEESLIAHFNLPPSLIVRTEEL